MKTGVANCMQRCNNNDVQGSGEHGCFRYLFAQCTCRDLVPENPETYIHLKYGIWESHAERALESALICIILDVPLRNYWG